MGKSVRPRRKVSINPTTGKLDLVSDNNFSYESVPTNKRLHIPENHQMVIREEFEIESGSELKLDGSLIVEE